MTQILTFALIALVASMVVGLPTTFADSTLDSLVNIATKARTQVQFQLERTASASDDLKALFERGSQETELLISAVKQNDVAQAKQHFLAAMKIFKQVSVELSEPQQAATALKTSQVDPAILTRYQNDIDRTEKYVDMLKNLVAKNDFAVDFSKAEELIQNARSSLAASDVPSLERITADLRVALNDVQNAIREQTIERQNERVRSFVNDYIVKIDAKLADLEPHMDEAIKPKFEEARQTITELKNQTSADETTKLLRHLDSLVKEIENYVQAKGEQPATETQTQDTSQARVEERQTEPKQGTQDDTKNQKIPAEVLRLEARLANIGPYVDENIKTKFETSERLLAKLINGETSGYADYLRTVRILDSLVDSLERYVDSLQNNDDNRSDKTDKNQSNKSDKEKTSTDRNN
ncbi:MAG TPA: hypothetical protein VD828_02005 [Candidatus Nitrosotenuis sp.]|nr:hypothetical protein [Candidatus Nitrosotenuis sp.]